MSLVPFSSSRPQCLNCMRRAVGGFNDTWLPSVRLQIRSKKKLAKSSTIKVRLLEDIPRYGRKGTIIPIPPGRMRNEFYPNKKAEYMTAAQLRDIGMLSTVVERDSAFTVARRMTSAQEIQSPIVVETNLLKPEYATKLASRLLPKNIVFYRTPTPSTSPVPQQHSHSVPETSTISAAAHAAAREPQKTNIYGSVTTADIAEHLRVILAENKDGARVVLKAEDITFINEIEEPDRVKFLGVFEIDIRIKGAKNSIQRNVHVKALEEALNR